MLDDEVMGWARYAHSMRVFVLNSGLFYIRPTLASLDLLDRIAYRLDTENGWDQAIFNEVSPHHISLLHTCLHCHCKCIPDMLVPRLIIVILMCMSSRVFPTVIVLGD